MREDGSRTNTSVSTDTPGRDRAGAFQPGRWTSPRGESATAAFEYDSSASCAMPRARHLPHVGGDLRKIRRVLEFQASSLICHPPNSCRSSLIDLSTLRPSAVIGISAYRSGESKPADIGKTALGRTSSRFLVGDRPVWAQQLIGMTLPNVRFLNGIDCRGYRSPLTVIGGS